MEWYQKSGNSVLDELKVDAKTGLTAFVAKKRLEQYGPNTLTASTKINPLKLFLSQFKDILVIILICAAVLSWVAGLINTSMSQKNDVDCDITSSDMCQSSGEGSESILIIGIVIAIALVGFFNEYKAEKTVESLKKLTAQTTKVKRDGRIMQIETDTVVVGDIVILEEGSKIPADCRIIQCSALQVNESSLTGESLPVLKEDNIISEKAVLGDRKNMVYAGTFITQGTAEAVVVETASATELGRIAQLVDSVDKEETPMQKKLDDLGKKLGMVVSIICALVFVFILLFANENTDKTMLQKVLFSFTAAVALAVAAIPEGLAFVVRISLALGARRMASKKALVKKLSAVEALGSTDIICTDKTGTLTKGEMKVRALYAGGELAEQLESKKITKLLEQLLLIGKLCNNAVHSGTKYLGDPTEIALLVASAELQKSYEVPTRIKEIPFTSERKFMSTVHKVNSGYFVASKGSMESTLARCKYYLDKDNKKILLTPEVKMEIIRTNKNLSSKALRVLAFAQKECDKLLKSDNEIESNMTFVGLQAMMDPPRKEVAEVIRRVQSEAGMKVVMITGDYIETAKAIAVEIGLSGRAVSGTEVESMSTKELEKQVEDISVYARVNPEHKIRIVKALKKNGHQVAMTGDGVNDAPALKAADIGIAMGITGTDVSKEAADVILLDDQLLTIINAIEEGRGIYDNVRKFVNFLISCNIAEVIAVTLGIFVFHDLMLTAVQLLFINIVTDGLPAVALGSDPTQSGILKASPDKFKGSIINARVWAEIMVFGALMAVALLLQYKVAGGSSERLAASSAVFVAMVIYEFVRLVDIRTDYRIKWFSNPLLSWSIIASFGALVAVVFIPKLAEYFQVIRPVARDWIIIGFTSAVLISLMKLLNPFLDRLIEKEHSIY